MSKLIVGGELTSMNITEILTDADYSKLTQFIYTKLGIDYDEKKKETVSTKVTKLTHQRKMHSVKDYVNFILNTTDATAIQEFFNAITTNTTEFFRENAHFEYIKSNLSSIIAEIPRIKRDGEIRVWSAPCSSGEESLTLSMVLQENLPHGIKPKILATDISEKVLNKANEGVYTQNECAGIPKPLLLKYFKKQPDGSYMAEADVKKCIFYRLFNLKGEFNNSACKKGFDIIFCRNLMIYFDQKSQEELINKFYNVLVPNGLFFIGHSESLLNKTHKFKYVKTAIFQK